MFGTCIFCNKPLGENTVIESFPVGRRLAFDPARGRLWVVCRKCERWNLSPLEERWEAVEACERYFRGTRMRASTENIGLARHPEGLELVRIGTPLRPEFAAWRYGDQFGRRRKRYIAYGAGAAAIGGAVLIGGAVTGLISATFLSQSGNFINLWVNGRTLAKLRTDDGRIIKLKQPELLRTRLLPAEDGSLTVILKKNRKEHVFQGGEADRVAGVLLPRLNRSGGKPTVVQDAVRGIEESGGPEVFLRSTVERSALETGRARGRHRKKRAPGSLGSLATPTRLALEMALHEEQERRALEGELKALELAWREAEEVAAIADNLLTPGSIDAFVSRHAADRQPARED